MSARVAGLKSVGVKARSMPAKANEMSRIFFSINDNKVLAEISEIVVTGDADERIAVLIGSLSPWKVLNFSSVFRISA